MKDQSALDEIRAGWHGVEVLRGRIQRGVLFAFAEGASSLMFVSDCAHNLPFFHAYAILNDTLLQWRDEGRFSCANRNMGPLMSASRASVNWIDYALIDEGRLLRNKVAHDGELVPRGDCWKFIDGIEAEFIQWGILHPKAEV